jgi:hypothetical protein
MLPACTGISSSVYPTAAPAPPGAAAAPLPARASAVPVTLTRDPPGAVEVAVVEVHGPIASHVLHTTSGHHAGSTAAPVTLAGLVAEFRRRVAEVGGDHARIDRFATRYETISDTYTYDCSTTETTFETRTTWRTDSQGRSQPQTESVPVTKREPKTCTGTRQVEVATLALTGRALRTLAGGKP